VVNVAAVVDDEDEDEDEEDEEEEDKKTSPVDSILCCTGVKYTSHGKT